jgi:hypothetical protein
LRRLAAVITAAHEDHEGYEGHEDRFFKNLTSTTFEFAEWLLPPSVPLRASDLTSQEFVFFVFFAPFVFHGAAYRRDPRNPT